MYVVVNILLLYIVIFFFAFTCFVIKLVQTYQMNLKAIWLLINEDRKICRSVGIFIYECFRLRREALKTS